MELNSNIQIKRLTDTAVLPTRGSEKAAGYDLYATANYEIAPHSTVKVGTGIAIALPDDTFGAIFARSGLATKKGLRPANCIGVCDSDYRGEYIVPLYNDTDEMQTVEAGERIAQLIIMPFIPVVFDEVNELDETARGAGGFGSTGR